MISGQLARTQAVPIAGNRLEHSMNSSDVTLLTRKILVGIVITLVPLGILTGGLWLTQRTINKDSKPNVRHAVETSHAN